jgi:hypothetical protein
MVLEKEEDQVEKREKRRRQRNKWGRCVWCSRRVECNKKVGGIEARMKEKKKKEEERERKEEGQGGIGRRGRWRWWWKRRNERICGRSRKRR